MSISIQAHSKVVYNQVVFIESMHLPNLSAMDKFWQKVNF